MEELNNIKKTQERYSQQYSQFKIVPETCNALWEVLRKEYMLKPTKDTWKKLAAD